MHRYKCNLRYPLWLYDTLKKAYFFFVDRSLGPVGIVLSSSLNFVLVILSGLRQKRAKWRMRQQRLAQFCIGSRCSRIGARSWTATREEDISHVIFSYNLNGPKQIPFTSLIILHPQVILQFDIIYNLFSPVPSYCDVLPVNTSKLVGCGFLYLDWILHQAEFTITYNTSNYITGTNNFFWFFICPKLAQTTPEYLPWRTARDEFIFQTAVIINASCLYNLGDSWLVCSLPRYVHFYRPLLSCNNNPIVAVARLVVSADT
jgi:hypothetical protein